MALIYKLIGVIRIAGLAILVFVGLLAGLCSGLIPKPAYAKLARLWHWGVTVVVGVDCRFTGADVEPGALVVSNHITWLDISVLGSRLPVVFLASSIIEGWPVLGWMISRAGTLFIERGTGAAQAVEVMSENLGAGQSVQIFPEGKTTDGTSVIKFQPRLMQSAINAGTSIQPVAIRYETKSGDRENRIRYDGDRTFPGSLWNTVCGGSFVAKVHVFEPIPVQHGRTELGKSAENTVRNWVESFESSLKII